jgi:predicted phage tail component-like protein
MIKESLYFTFAGRKSSDYGILNVSIASGLYEESFMASRSIKEVFIRGKENPYFQELTKEPKSFQVTFAFQDTWNDDLINEVARWFDVEYYQPLIFSEEPEKVYYVMPVNESSVTHNGLKQGYLTLTFRCESPYSYSPMKVTPWYDFSQSTVLTLDIYNKGDKTILPEINIVKVGDGDLTITNLSNKGEISQFVSLLDGEELYVHGENEVIETSLVNTYRFDSFNDNYLKLYYGKNTLQINGACKIKFQYRYKFII